MPLPDRPTARGAVPDMSELNISSYDSETLHGLYDLLFVEKANLHKVYNWTKQRMEDRPS